MENENYIDMEGTVRKEYADDSIILHFDYYLEAFGTISVGRDDEPALNELLAMLTRRERRIERLEELVRAVDDAHRLADDIEERYKADYADAVGRDWKRADGEKDAEIARLRAENEELRAAAERSGKGGRASK